MNKKTKSKAFKILYSNNNIILNKPFKLDMRYNESKQIITFLKVNQLSSSEKQTVINKRKARIKNKEIFTNILNNPLVKDFLNNKGAVRRIYKDHLDFHGRNHWAKNEFDLKILKVLNKSAETK